MRDFFRLLFVLAVIFSVAACSSNKKDEVAEKVAPPEQLYNDAMEKVQQRFYKTAIEDFEKIEQNYPFSEWSTKGKLMSAFASYKNNDYDDAIIKLDSFIKVHPGNESIAYAYYLRALSYYDRIVDVARDQQTTEEARQALKEVVARFPETEYGRDAKLKLDLVVDHLAGKEMEIGRFYLNKKAYVAAINRFAAVVEKFQSTSHVEEALHRLVEAYYSIGAVDQAQKYAAVLGHNYPNGIWYKRSFEILNPLASQDKKKKDSWISRKLGFES